MVDAISETAQLFQQEIGGERRPARGGGERSTPAPERMFTHLGDVEGGDEAGGDGDFKVDPKTGDFLLDDNGQRIPLRGKPPRQRERDPEDERDEDPEEEGDEDPDADDQGEEGEEGDEEDDPVLKRKYEVMVDGEPVEMSLGEAVRGYIRQQTFHRRLTALAEEATAVKAERTALSADRQKVAQQLDDLAKEMEAVMPPEPNWDELYSKNPQNARQLQKQYEDLRKKITDYRAKRDNALKEHREKSIAEFNALADTEFRKFASACRWRDQQAAEKDLTMMREAGKRHGFTDQEIDSTIDSRMLMVLRKAALYDQMTGNRPRPVKDIRRSARTNEERPGESRQSSTSVARDRNNGQFTRRREPVNSIDAAAAVFETLITPRRGRRRG